MTHSDQSAIDREITVDYLLERCEALRWEIGDLMEVAERDELGVAAQLEGAARSLYRVEERLTR